MNNEIFDQFDSIITVITFGSKARGDNDENSDSDIFILCENIDFREISDLKSNLGKLIKIHPSNFSIYCKTEFNLMLKKGSLFVWHLKLEGKIIFSRIDLDSIFKELQPYSNHKKDLLLYELLLGDSKESIILFGVNIFDLATLFTVCRNCCMVICHKLNYISFGRLSVYYTTKELLKEKILLKESNYLMLLSWKLLYSRGITFDDPLPSLSETELIFKEIEDLISIGLKVCDDE